MISYSIDNTTAFGRPHHPDLNFPKVSNFILLAVFVGQMGGETFET
jgi:hypothetical protein